MMARGHKLATVIENATGQGLTMKVGSPQYRFVRLASMKKGGQFTVRLSLDWTYQEFVLEGKSDAATKLFLSSDDCCDYERITVKEVLPGVFVAEMVARKRELGGGREDSKEEDDAATPAPPSVSLKESVCRWRFW